MDIDQIIGGVVKIVHKYGLAIGKLQKAGCIYTVISDEVNLFGIVFSHDDIKAFHPMQQPVITLK